MSKEKLIDWSIELLFEAELQNLQGQPLSSLDPSSIDIDKNGSIVKIRDLKNVNQSCIDQDDDISKISNVGTNRLFMTEQTSGM